MLVGSSVIVGAGTVLAVYAASSQVQMEKTSPYQAVDEVRLTGQLSSLQVQYVTSPRMTLSEMVAGSEVMPQVVKSVGAVVGANENDVDSKVTDVEASDVVDGAVVSVVELTLDENAVVKALVEFVEDVRLTDGAVEIVVRLSLGELVVVELSVVVNED